MMKRERNEELRGMEGREEEQKGRKEVVRRGNDEGCKVDGSEGSEGMKKQQEHKKGRCAAY